MVAGISSGMPPDGGVAFAADRARRRTEVETAIRQQALAARMRQQEAIERDRADLDALYGQDARLPTSPEQWRREQALRNDIDRRIAEGRRGVTVTPTGPGGWIVRDGHGTAQAVCREIDGVLTC